MDTGRGGGQNVIAARHQRIGGDQHVQFDRQAGDRAAKPLRRAKEIRRRAGKGGDRVRLADDGERHHHRRGVDDPVGQGIAVFQLNVNGPIFNGSWHR